MPRKRRNNQLNVQADWMNTVEGVVSLAEAKELYLKEIRALAAHTKRWHRENLSALERILEKQKIVVQDCRDLSPAFLKDHYIYYMLETMKLKKNTINGRIRTVRGLIHFLAKSGLLPRDWSCELSILKTDKVIIQTFTEEQIHALLKQPDQHTFTGLRDYTLMLLLFETGIRLEESLNIELTDIRLKDGQILIKGKGGKQRIVPFQSKMRKTLQSYLQARGNPPQSRLFCTLDHNPISKRHVQDLIHNYGEMAQIKGVRVSPHTFRHTMAKFYILNGGDIFSLQRILGHSSMETVKIYVEMFSSDVMIQHQKFSFVENRL